MLRVKYRVVQKYVRVQEKEQNYDDIETMRRIKVIEKQIIYTSSRHTHTHAFNIDNNGDGDTSRLHGQ